MEPVHQQPLPQPPQHAAPKQEHISPLTTGKSALDSFGIAIFFIIVVELVLLIGLNLYQASKIADLDKRQTSAKTKLATADYKTINTEIDGALAGDSLLKTALDSKVHWSGLFNQLNAVTPKDVKLSSVSISEDGSVHFDGQTTSMSSLAQALVSWQSGVPNHKTPLSDVILASNGFADANSKKVVTFSITAGVNQGSLQ